MFIEFTPNNVRVINLPSHFKMSAVVPAPENELKRNASKNSTLSTKTLIGDRELLRNILSNKTKDPISRDIWIRFVQSTYTVENTMILLNIMKFVEVYHFTCSKIGLSSNITEEVVIFPSAEGMMLFECTAIDENKLKDWCGDICLALIDTFIKIGSPNEINLSSKVRDDCLQQYRNGKYHPSIFKDVKESIQKSVIENDLPKFKEFALDQNIELQHRRIRGMAAIFNGILTFVFYGFMLAYGVQQYYRLLGFILIFGAFIGYFQWSAKFCVYFADKKQKNTSGYTGLKRIEDDYACQYQGKRSKVIKMKTMACTLTVLAIFFVLPPYNF